MAVLAAGLLTGLSAQAGDLSFPVDCQLGQNCFIQNYVDRNPGSGIADFTCGPLTYNGHKGTDIRLIDRVAMAEGVQIRSATAGTVIGTRDGMADIAQGSALSPDVTGRECGNGVMIQRKDGWRFQYCHMKEGSVSVEEGQEIAEGDILGLIGLSGRTEFPHLHFVVRDQAGRVMDPFDARQQDEACSLRDRRSLWRDLDAQDYQPGGPLAAGFLDRVPEYGDIKQGKAQMNDLSTDATALVFWAHFFGLRAGDRLELAIRGPDGDLVAEQTHLMTKNRALQFRAIGRKRRQDWQPGVYQGQARLIRDGHAIESISAEITSP